MRFFQKQIYYSCYLLYKLVLKLRHPEIKEIWYRNSFYFGYWEFLKSDIDITVAVECASKNTIAELSRSHALFRRFLPVIGELVIYSEAHKAALLRCVNSYELSRDPVLVKKYDLNKEKDDFEKIIFLHKFITANWFKKDIDSHRQGKIDYYITHIGLNEKKPFPLLLNDLAALLHIDPAPFKADYQKEIELFFKHEGFSISNIIYCLFYNHLCYLKPILPLNPVEKTVLEKTLLWELWGCFSYQASIDALEMEQHFTRMIDQLEQLTCPAFASTFIGLAKELELIKS